MEHAEWAWVVTALHAGAHGRLAGVSMGSTGRRQVASSVEASLEWCSKLLCAVERGVFLLRRDFLSRTCRQNSEVGSRALRSHG